MTQLDLSARGYHRVLKLVRTIAGLAGMEGIQSAHLVEALPSAPVRISSLFPSCVQ